MITDNKRRFLIELEVKTDNFKKLLLNSKALRSDVEAHAKSIVDSLVGFLTREELLHSKGVHFEEELSRTLDYCFRELDRVRGRIQD